MGVAMTQDEIIRMAREAGIGDFPNKSVAVIGFHRIERFAALVAAHEREKALRQEHGVPDTVSPLDFVVGSVKQAVLAEREACAKVCEGLPLPGWREELAAAIRARGK